MPTRQQEPLRPMTTEEQAALERLTKASSARVDRVRRPRALLAVAAGQTFDQAAGQSGFWSGTAIADLVARCNQHGLTALVIAAA